MSYSEPERNVHALWCHTSSDILLIQTSCYIVHFCKLVLVQTLIPDKSAGTNSNTESKAINEEFFLSSWSLLECSRLFAQTITSYTWHSMVPQKCNECCLPHLHCMCKQLHEYTLSASVGATIKFQIRNVSNYEYWTALTHITQLQIFLAQHFHEFHDLTSDHQNFLTIISAAHTLYMHTYRVYVHRYWWTCELNWCY